jgi:hypothetical protein
MRGRVMALRFAVARGGTPIGTPIVGWVANGFGPGGLDLRPEEAKPSSCETLEELRRLGSGVSHA